MKKLSVKNVILILLVVVLLVAIIFVLQPLIILGLLFYFLLAYPKQLKHEKEMFLLRKQQKEDKIKLTQPQKKQFKKIKL